MLSLSFAIYYSIPIYTAYAAFFVTTKAVICIPVYCYFLPPNRLIIQTAIYIPAVICLIFLLIMMPESLYYYHSGTICFASDNPDYNKYRILQIFITFCRQTQAQTTFYLLHHNYTFTVILP